MRIPSTSRLAIVHTARALMPGVALTVAVWIAVFWRLGYPSFWDSDEAHHAQATREMLASGNRPVPSVDGRPFFDKSSSLTSCNPWYFERWARPSWRRASSLHSPRSAWRFYADRQVETLDTPKERATGKAHRVGSD